MTGFRAGVRLAVDWGDVRIGVAACDPQGLVAFPLATVAAGETAVSDLATLIHDHQPLEVLIGLPRSLSGGEGPAAHKIGAHARRLASSVTVPLRLVDERLTTVTASRRLRESGKKARQQRALIDAAAAVALLEHALALERGRGDQPGELVSASGGPD